MILKTVLVFIIGTVGFALLAGLVFGIAAGILKLAENALWASKPASNFLKALATIVFIVAVLLVIFSIGQEVFTIFGWQLPAFLIE